MATGRYRKPFGRDLKTAIALNETIVDAFSEENTYRIDHYLGKEMLQNLLVIRFGNILFEPLWNKEYIEQIQLSSSETLGVEKRGPYYEQSGAIRDMVQSHMLQMLSLIAMERPSNLSPEAIRDAKVEVLNNSSVSIVKPFGKMLFVVSMIKVMMARYQAIVRRNGYRRHPTRKPL